LFRTRSLFWKGTILVVRRSSLVPMLSRKGLLAIAAVVDVALQKDDQPISAKTLAARHGLPPRYLETVLQALVRGGVLKGVRGPHGGYLLARERHGVTANDILRAVGTADVAEEGPSSELMVKVVLPVLSVVERECGQALSRISLDDMVNHAALNGHETGRHENGEPRGADL
jgi:Rrf2 family iron-sulfur cluster assembly transcriptional regulator